MPGAVIALKRIGDQSGEFQDDSRQDLGRANSTWKFWQREVDRTKRGHYAVVDVTRDQCWRGRSLADSTDAVHGQIESPAETLRKSTVNFRAMPSLDRNETPPSRLHVLGDTRARAA